MGIIGDDIVRAEQADIGMGDGVADRLRLCFVNNQAGFWGCADNYGDKVALS